jgi:uncharacterized protein YqjF (DUF2071 family)
LGVDFDHNILNHVSHRPWPMPDRPWLMTQTWNDLLFAHWPLEPGVLRAKVPSAFELDLFDGRAWFGVVPFYMTNVTPRFVPPLPGVSAFPELNVRTYVRAGGKPGVYFFSLDAGSALAVWAAYMLLDLPYFSASMHVERAPDAVRYSSRRTGSSRREPPTCLAELRADYQAIGDAFNPVEGTLEYFLTERYCLYALDHAGHPYRLDIHHPPWPLQPARARFEANTMAEASGITLPDLPPLLHFARRQDMVAWGPARFV